MRIHLALTLLALSFPTAAFAQDSDADGVSDSLDAFPCDQRATSAAFFPAEAAQGMMLFEDRWPARGDLDFNDVVLSQQMIFRLNAAGRVTSMHARIVPLALGGTIHNGLALRLPVPRSSATAISRTIGNVTAPVTAVAAESELTIVLSDDLREQFEEQLEAINSRDDRARLATTPFDLEITFQPAVSIDLSAAPFDLFIFQSDAPSHEIHRPQYAGGAAMDASLFGTRDDGSAGGRWFVDTDGLPFALSIPELAPYPAEEAPISSLFPEIMTFAASGGTQGSGFYRSNVVDTFAYRDVAGLGALSPSIVQPAIDRSCISVNSGPFVRIDVSFTQTTATPWVTMWEVGLMNGPTRLTSGFTVQSSVANAQGCSDNNTGTYCLNVTPPSTYSFVATSGNLPTNTGLMLHPWYTRYPSQFTITGVRADGSSVTMLSYVDDGGWISNTERVFTYVNTPPPPGGGNNGVFSFSGANQTYVVPEDVTSISVAMWGGGGGGGSYSRSQLSNGGGGGYTEATIAVTPGETLAVIVGGGGEGYRGSVAQGGFGGGGNAAAMINAGGGGGGRSAIRRGAVELVTAGGGGGGGYDYAGAAGGGAAGQRNPGDGGGGFGGTATGGGQGGGTSYVGESGVQFRGGTATYAGGGGGGGYFGGGGAGTVSGYGNGGGGGSGWAGGPGVSAASLVPGSGPTPGNASSAERSGAGQGGAGVISGNGNSGVAGRVIIRY